MLTLKSLAVTNTVLDFQNIFCRRKRYVLLIFSLLCTIIVLTQPAVALPKPISSSSLSLSNNTTNNIRMLSMLKQETTLQKLETDVLTPGQQVINAVPDKERGDFVMYELAIALKKTNQEYDSEEHHQRWLRNLEDVEDFYGKKVSVLKNVPIYENFSTDLLQWIEQEFNLTHQNVYNQLRSRSQLLCTSDGTCYNAKNIGCYCCPF